MKKKSRVIRLLAMALTLAMMAGLIAACGDSGDTGPAPPTAAESTTPSEVDPDSLWARSLADDRDRWWRMFVNADDDLFTRVWDINPEAVGYYTLDMTIFNPYTAEKVQWYITWARMITYLTNGGLTINYHPGGTLASGPETLLAINTGVADIGWVVPSFVAADVPISDLTNLALTGLGDPATLGTRVLWEVFLQTPEWQREIAELNNLHLICLYANGGNLLGSSAPIRTLEDAEGVAIRGAAGAGVDSIGLMGANPISMGTADIYEALVRGVIDGYVGDITMVKSWNLQDITGYYSTFALFTSPMLFVMNLDVFNSLPAEYREIIYYFSGFEMSMAKAEHYDLEALDIWAGIDPAQLVNMEPGMIEELKRRAYGFNLEKVARQAPAGFDGHAFMDVFMDAANRNLAQYGYDFLAMAGTRDTWLPTTRDYLPAHAGGTR